MVSFTLQARKHASQGWIGGDILKRLRRTALTHIGADGDKVREVHVDMGYRGHNCVGNAMIHADKD
jgi:hypothetical protein